MEDKVCPIMSGRREFIDNDMYKKILNIPCLREKCQLWVEVWVDTKKEWRCGLIKS